MIEFIWHDHNTDKFRVLEFKDSDIEIALSCIYNSIGSNVECRLWYLPDVPKEEGSTDNQPKR